MRRYDSYKDSGQQWLGEIPSHWRLRKMKFSFTERTSKGFPNESLLSATQSHGVIPQSMYENRTVQATKNLETLKLVEKGDFVISLRSFQGGIEYAYYRGIISPAYTILFPYAIDSGFFKHLGKSQVFIDLLQSTVTGIREGQNIDYSKLKQTYLPIPPKEEQQAISHYIDRIAADIDKAIAQQQRMIDLLNERKQIIIQQAVTKGLNPNVKMKNSGVEWIGQVPEHWDIKCLKYTCKINGRVGYRGYTANDLVQEGEGAYTIGGKHITSCKLDLSDADFISWKKYYESPEIMVKKGDIVMAQRGSLGKAALIEEEISEATINPSLVLLNKISINAKFLHHYLISNATLTNIQLLNTATAVPMISQNQISNMKILVPPLSEQQQIVDHIEKQIACINKTIAKQQRTIELLKERKQIIINEAVTGKIKVI